ncbi:MAG TPA: PKD domain-containing protein [Ohtaekwangia sp.]|nr:PKD domain-containing protein [Ohtaekwangia sp.]
MKNLRYSILWMLTLLLVHACKDEDPQLGAVPTQADAAFTFTPSAENDNIIDFSSPTGAFLKKWDFGNGTKAEGDNVKGVYPLQGTYEVTLTVFTSGGSISTKQTVEIAETDPTLLDLPVYNMLTGGKDAPEGKKWIVDATTGGHFGVGPAAGTGPDWYAAAANEKAGAGLYDDEFTFILNGFSFVQTTNGDVFINTQQAANFPGAVANAGDFTAPHTAPDDLSWTVTEDGDNQFLTISTGGFIGYYTGVSTYQIMTLEENKLVLKYYDAANADLAWYLRLIPADFTPPPPPPPAKTTLPVDFEGTKPPFNGFGGTAYDVVDNPDATGINTSAKVAQYIKGLDGNWAGIETALSAKLDFSVNTLIKYKVYSPVAGKALFKLESVDGSATPIEVFADVTQVNEWQELTFDFSGAPSNTFDKIALFLDFDNNNGGTFYLDDIRQASVPAVLSEADLTGGASKTWVLRPAAESFGVGPAKGSDDWWPNGADISSERPCLFNDEFIFKTGGVYEYDTKGDIYGEPYMGGLTAACTDESNLPAEAQAWGSGTHTFTFTPATESDPAYITVSGTGAFIGLPKAYNGGEYAAAPPTADGSVKYEVLNYVKTDASETIFLTVDISADGTAFWNFVLIAQ